MVWAQIVGLSLMLAQASQSEAPSDRYADAVDSTAHLAEGEYYLGYCYIYVGRENVARIRLATRKKLSGTHMEAEIVEILDSQFYQGFADAEAEMPSLELCEKVLGSWAAFDKK